MSGGDRHCGKANTVINTTDAATFAEFAEEVRADKRSEVILMPEYRQPLIARQLKSIAEITNFYPEFPDGRRHCYDRVYFENGEGLNKLSSLWTNGGPRWLRCAVWMIRFLDHKSLRTMFSLTSNRKDRLPKQIKVGKPESAVIDKSLPTKAH